MMEKFEPRINEYAEEDFKDIVLKREKQNFEGTIRILERGADGKEKIPLENITVDNIMDYLFPTKESLRNDEELRTKAQKYLEEQKRKRSSGGLLTKEEFELKKNKQQKTESVGKTLVSDDMRNGARGHAYRSEKILGKDD